MRFLTAFTVLLLFTITCDDDISVSIEQFKYSEGQKFNYDYTYSFDQNDSIQVVDSGVFVLEIVSTNSQIGNYFNLIEFKVYNKNTPEFYSKSWYQQSSNGFYDVAYQNPGIDPGIQPKVMFSKGIDFSRIVLPTFQVNSNYIEITTRSKTDSITVRDDIRLTAPLPLNLGTESWSEFTNPFTRTSAVTGSRSIKVGGKTEHVLEITTSFNDSEFDELEYYSYFNEKGLIKRTVIIKDQEITSENGEFIGYYDSISEITLRN